ncbi:hypothetical protein EV360DRAFT_78949 [Lentinula raphanica]|nr:hypothetical protein EV360DRAFT_78949 [Lentinula raphanica]
MPSSSDRRALDRPNLPPIRDLFGDELNRLRMNDDDGSAQSNQQRHHPDFYPHGSQRGTFHRHREFSPSITHHPPSNATPSHSVSYGREQNWPLRTPPTHVGYGPRTATATEPRFTGLAPPNPASNYQYTSMAVGASSYQYPSAPGTYLQDTSHSFGHRPYASHHPPPNHRTSASLDNQRRSEERPYSSTQRVQTPSGDLPSSSAPSSAKYECSFCGKGFNRPSSLKIHLNSHTGEKPFLCPFDGCGRSFSVLSNMRRHARVHNQAAQTSDEDTVSLSRPGSSRTSTVAPVNWHQYRRGSTASDVSSSDSRHDRSESSDSEEEGYGGRHQ